MDERWNTLASSNARGQKSEEKKPAHPDHDYNLKLAKEFLGRHKTWPNGVLVRISYDEMTKNGILEFAWKSESGIPYAAPLEFGQPTIAFKRDMVRYFDYYRQMAQRGHFQTSGSHNATKVMSTYV